jgi:hypothetical protein
VHTELVPLTDDLIREVIRRRAAQGYDPDLAVVDGVCEALVDQHGAGADVEERVVRLAPGVLAELAAAQRTWPIPTDCDRLDRAFAALERGGVVARQHFTCCSTCGHAEIGAELDEARVRGEVEGYVFFHWQDTARAVDGDGLMLSFGAATGEGTHEPAFLEASARIGARIVEALRAEGLAPAWSGDPARRIELPITWRRRRRRS